jgi:nucleoside-diphosphate-sugar epimerase
MNAQARVLLLGGTGRTGGRVLTQLLERGLAVRAIVRSAARLPEGAADDPLLTVVEADLLSLPAKALQRHLEGCDTVISCLGHNLTLKGILGPPFDVVSRAVSNLARAVEAMQPSRPVRFILMSTVSVNRPEKADMRRGAGERVFLWALRGLMPPAQDNQRAADYLVREIGPSNPYVEWVVVRPDTLLDGDVTGYRLSDELVSSIFRPDETNMANVAHFMCELATDDAAWRRWRCAMPVVVNAGVAS